MISTDNKLLSNNNKGYNPIVKKENKKDIDWRRQDNWLFPAEPKLKRKKYKTKNNDTI